jgi:hypothetical protein
LWLGKHRAETLREVAHFFIQTYPRDAQRGANQ